MGMGMFGKASFCGCNKRPWYQDFVDELKTSIFGHPKDSGPSIEQMTKHELQWEVRALRSRIASSKRAIPDIHNFAIIATQQIGRHLLVWLTYQNCWNYEGKKILLFKDLTTRQFKQLKICDPHFCDSKDHPSPIARFEPTWRGWKMGQALASLYDRIEK